uniref:Uncharacterized protein n=1 Tax=Heterosigma akashiwo TaxID=2829 RepID=A0A7S4DBH3_HETAK|mmetsp:Transcript_19743/g.34135  ORF Transcript_19743/g.34135 Transcript_19743/m.34135 type:complete len:211 (+) Transcript_19743:723-1355(+)
MMTTENRSVHTLQKRNGEKIGWRVFIYYSEGRRLACWSSVNKQGAVYWTKKVLYNGPRKKNDTFCYCTISSWLSFCALRSECHDSIIHIEGDSVVDGGAEHLGCEPVKEDAPAAAPSEVRCCGKEALWGLSSAHRGGACGVLHRGLDDVRGVDGDPAEHARGRAADQRGEGPEALAGRRLHEEGIGHKVQAVAGDLSPEGCVQPAKGKTT